MTPAQIISQHMAKIGSKGGSKSKRTLSREQALELVRLKAEKKQNKQEEEGK